MAGVRHPFEGDKEVVLGIRAVDAPGHTPGHTAFQVTSAKDQLIVLSNTTHIPTACLEPRGVSGSGGRLCGDGLPRPGIPLDAPRPVTA